MNNKILLIISIALCQLAGIIGSIFTSKSVKTWYITINKPAFNPPGWVFGPVWITLYALMGVSLYLIWKSPGGSEFKKTAFVIFFIQLILNALWSFLFFGLESPFLGFIEIIVLWFFIALTIFYFSKISKVAVYLLIPYIAWVSFAAVLNFFLWRLN